MIATTEPIGLHRTTAPSGIAPRRRRRTVKECRARARDFLSTLVTSPPDHVSWDETNRLEGHVHLGGRELILIAVRDEDHQPLVLTVEDWDEVRHDSRNRCALLTEYAISDRPHLEAALARSGNG
jgi:hypothetical protein